MQQYGIRPRGEIDQFGYSRDFFDLRILPIGLLFRHELTPGFKILGGAEGSSPVECFFTFMGMDRRH